MSRLNEHKEGNREERNSTPTNADFLNLFTTQSLMSHNNNIVEFDDIKEGIEELIKNHKSKAINETIKKSIPNLVVMTGEQPLPGVILYARSGLTMYLMPILFYKKGAADTIDDVSDSYLGDRPTYTKYAETFMNKQVRDSVKTMFSTFDGKKMENVFLISNYVVDINNFVGSAKEEPIAIKNIANVVIGEWYNGMMNFVLQSIAHNKGRLGVSPFRGGETLFGKDNSALARYDVPEYPLIINGRTEPYNLMVKLVSTPKGDIDGGRLSAAKSVATTYLKVELELMSSDMFRHEYGRDRSRVTRGPLVPVISVGKTIPGQQLQFNDSVLCDIIGIYNALTVNNPMSFTEAIRQRNVGSRGSLANLAQVTYKVAGDDVPPSEILTAKSMLNQKDVQYFMESYISQRAVYAKDLPTYMENPSNSEIWWNANANNTEGGAVYKRSVYLALDKISGGRLDSYIEEVRNNPNAWIPGKPMMRQSSYIVPVGTAMSNNQFFNLEELGQMMLRDSACYGDDDQAVDQLMGLFAGSCNKELRHRQHEIKRCLEELFGQTLSLVGFKSRWIYEDNFLEAVMMLVGGNANIQVTSTRGTRNWESQPSSDYLLRTTAVNVRNSSNLTGTAMTANSIW